MSSPLLKPKMVLLLEISKELRKSDVQEIILLLESGREFEHIDNGTDLFNKLRWRGLLKDPIEIKMILKIIGRNDLAAWIDRGKGKSMFWDTCTTSASQVGDDQECGQQQASKDVYIRIQPQKITFLW